MCATMANGTSRHGGVGEPTPIHPHPFRHFRRTQVRQIVRMTKSLPSARKQAGWARLRMAYLGVGDDEVREIMRGVRHH
jgi:hypothetical protein